jgi:hypothetical protein
MDTGAKQCWQPNEKRTRNGATWIGSDRTTDRIGSRKQIPFQVNNSILAPYQYVSIYSTTLRLWTPSRK